MRCRAAAAAVGAVGLSEGERWIAERLDPVVAGPAAGYLAGVELYLPVAQVRGPIAHLAGFAKLPDASVGGGVSADGAWGFEPGKNASADGVGDKTGADPEKEAKEAKKRDAAAEKVGALTEVVVLRDPPLVQVYRVESYGRRWRRALVFASAAAWCLADIDPDGHPALEDPSERYLLSAARLGAAASSLVISRHLTDTQGRQQFVPARHLRGLIPAAILRDYVFWQAADGDLYGDAVPTATHPRTVIHAKLVKGAGADSGDALAGVGGGGEHAAVIRRVPIAATDALGEREPGSVGILPGEPVPEGYVPGQLTLVDLLYAPAVLGAEAEAEASGVGASSTSAKSPARAAAEALRSLARCLAAVEGLAHCLAWTAAEVDPSSHARGGGGVIGAMVGAAAAVARTAAAVTGVSAAGTLEIVAVDRVELPRLGISFAAAREGARARRDLDPDPEVFVSSARNTPVCSSPRVVPRVGRASRRDAARARPGGTRRRAERVASGERGASTGARSRHQRRARGEEGVGGGGGGGSRRGGHEGIRHGHGPGPMGSRVDEKRGEGRGHYVYPVHASHAVMHATTLPAALYLTLSRFLARRYADVCKLADLCVSESQPTPEEAQLWCAFAGVANDPSPDATAARLRLSVAAYGTPAESLLPWEVEPELASYVATWRHVSAACRLPANEEQELLDSCSAEGMKAPLMLNRASYLYIRARAEDAAERRAADGGGTSLAGASASASVAACPLVYPETPQHSAFDAVEDRSCLEEGITGEGPLGSLAGLKHSFVQYEERDITGAAGLQKVGEWLDSGSFALDGAHGFPLLFELLTGTVPLRVLTGDDPHRWGCALLRFVPPEQSLKRGTLMSTLRLLASSKYLADAAPKVEERGMSARMAAVFTHDGAIGMLLRRVQPFLRERARRGRAAFLSRTPRTGRRSDTNPRARLRFPIGTGAASRARPETPRGGHFRASPTHRARRASFRSRAIPRTRGAGPTSTP